MMKFFNCLYFVLFICFICGITACKKKPKPADKTENPPVSQEPVVQTPWTNESFLPFDLPPASTMRSTTKKVFAHYFTQFPISIDNKASDKDYYQTGYLDPNGENGIHKVYGGYLRSRPLPQPVRAEANWMDVNMEEEVRRAIAIGLDGFTCDLLDYQGYHWDRVVSLLNAANHVDPEFKIVLMPDMEAAFKSHPDQMKNAIKILSDYPAAYRTADGQLVVSPYNAQNQNAEWWKNWLTDMKASGTDIALFPVFQDWERYAASFSPISYGMSDWGWRSVKAQESWRGVPQKAKALGPLWMMAVSPQDMRPRELRYWEAGNSEEYRVMWENAIYGGADWVQLVTWNDYGESTVIAPSTGTQYSFYDLTAYYTTWFKTGTKPEILRDVLYYFYRMHATTAPATEQKKLFNQDIGSDSPLNEIELLAFLKEPGTLEIEAGGKKIQKSVSAGVTSFKVPMLAGRPVFRLLRGGNSIVTLPGAFEIKDKIAYQNLLYCGGSSSRLPVSEK